MPDPAWSSFSLNAGDVLVCVAVALTLAVLAITAVERLGRCLAPPPRTAEHRWGRILPRPGRERPWDWFIDGEAVATTSPGPCEPMQQGLEDRWTRSHA